jgi:hypothetical protein
MLPEHQHQEFIEGFELLFRGRADARGTETGGCERQPVGEKSFCDHLEGNMGLGIYPMVPFPIEGSDSGQVCWKVRWGCVDLDVKADHKRRWDYNTKKDAWIAACNLELALSEFGIRAWIESTKSGGFHVWVFVNEWVPALYMRNALLVACQIADVPPTEVNPKNTDFDSVDTLGNYVRLPYLGALSGNTQRPILHPTTSAPMNWVEFVDEAMNERAHFDKIKAVHLLWRPPVKAAPIMRDMTVPAHDLMSRRLKAVVENGPLKAEDRSGWLYYVARLCADDGLTINEACDIVTRCDDMHTRKFTERQDGHTQIMRTVERAYA